MGGEVPGVGCLMLAKECRRPRWLVVKILDTWHTERGHSLKKKQTEWHFLHHSSVMGDVSFVYQAKGYFSPLYASPKVSP